MKPLVSDSDQAGWSGEVHLTNLKGRKVVVRKCKSLDRAKHYEKLLKDFEKYKIFPKLIKRENKNVFLEYIKGRDLREKEILKVFEQLGKMAAIVNKEKFQGYKDKRFNKQLKEYSSKKEQKRIIKIYNFLKKKSKPLLALDLNDLDPINFRIRKGKVFLVDIEGIKTRARLFCTGKGFTKWSKTKKQQEAFFKGYKKVSSTKFYTKYYKDFILLNYLIQDLVYKKRYGKRFSPRKKIKYEKILDNLLKKYS